MSVECKDGLFIRMSLMKGMEFDDKGNTVKMGPGIVFAELHEAASNHSRYVASGWATTVGVIGWSIGGGLVVDGNVYVWLTVFGLCIVGLVRSAGCQASFFQFGLFLSEPF